MNKLLLDLIIGINLTGDIEKDVVEFFTYHGHQDISVHSIKVAYEAKRLSNKFGVNEYKAFISGCLHDMGKIFSKDMMIIVCNELGITILPEEYIAPSLLHSKISKVMAMEIFFIEDKEILDAIECHSTLKANAGMLDMILFIADKISWDKIHNKFFINDVINGLENSLKQDAFAYLKYLYRNKEDMKVFHPWCLEAYNDLLIRLGELDQKAPIIKPQ